MEINYDKIYAKFRDIEESLTRLKLKQFGAMAREDLSSGRHNHRDSAIYNENLFRCRSGA